MQFLGKPAVERVRAWPEASCFIYGALFRAVNKSEPADGERLSTITIRRVITERAKAVGEDARLSGHSQRVGNAQRLTIVGVSLVKLQVAGRWHVAGHAGALRAGATYQAGC